MCLAAQLTVMTTIPWLRMALRTGSCVNKTPNTTRDPTYARKQINNRARMPRIIRTSNTSTTPPARDKRILRGDVSQLRATNNYHPHQEHPTGIPLEHNHDQIRRHEQILVNAELLRVRIKTMREKKGCLTDTAPPGTNQTTSVDNCDDQDPDPMAEGIGLGATSGIDEDGGLQEHRDKPERHERPMRPERHETRPSIIPEHVRLTTSTTPALATV